MITPESLDQLRDMHKRRGTYEHCIIGEYGDSNERRYRFNIGGAVYILDLDAAVPTARLLPEDDSALYRRTASGLQYAYDKVAAQVRQANIGASYPRLEEPIEEGFVYPKDNVISIRKGRKLNRRG